MQMEAKIWIDSITLPTYPVGEPNKNPLFLEKRVYQGSSGKLYPLPFTDKIYDEKVDKNYEVVYLENEYIQVMIMPSMGGKIYRALDKTNQYDFVYYNQVVKPALVGLAGPWVSGGIEFNWPQHHRPSTFAPVEYKIAENDDGSKTCWVSEIDKMYGTKGMAGFTVYPDKAYIEITGQLYNRTEMSQTFLWWANPAVAVNEDTKSIFPPDVHAVFDHGKRDVSRFPIATGTYYKMDYSEGVDISRYKNIPVPTSYMAYHSDYNFVGGYDFGVEAGILHVANHHISPGKKQWTWGNGDFGQAWDRNLTDDDGPYIELMTGVFTDNQPDFTWLAPKEVKTFKQYFMPYKGVGEVKNATADLIINLNIHEASAEAEIRIYATGTLHNLKVLLLNDEHICFETIIEEASPREAIQLMKPLSIVKKPYEYKLEIYNQSNQLLIDYQMATPSILKTPKAAKPALSPNEIMTTEQLFFTGQHLEQYRHATYEASDYYLEALGRDPSDYRNNNAYGLLLYRRGAFKEAITYLKRAIETITGKNPNPYDGEAFYNLGLAYKKQGEFQLAYNTFYKCVWNGAWQASGYYEISLLDGIRKDFTSALEHIELALIRNWHSTKARNFKGALLRRMGRIEEGKAWNKETLKIDALDVGAQYELYLIAKMDEPQKAEEQLLSFNNFTRRQHHNTLELATDYGDGGLYEEAIHVLKQHIDLEKEPSNIYPMIYYFLGYYQRRTREDDTTINVLAAAAKPDYCFPNRLSELVVLEEAITVNPKDAKAYYYLGNLCFDKKQYDYAIKLWEKSTELDALFPTVQRNLALAYVNKREDLAKGRLFLESAHQLDAQDARIVFELDQLYKKLNMDEYTRKEFLDRNIEQVKERDDLMIEYVSLANNLERYEEAKSFIDARNFHPWEGGEGKVTGQYKRCRIELAKKALLAKNGQKAIEELVECSCYPHNLGEGKLQGTAENDIYYYMGLAYQLLGEKEKAEEAFYKAISGIEEPTDAMFYNDQPADMMFYQGLAYRVLGIEDKAKSKFNKLLSYGEQHLYDEKKIDFFAVSLPDFLVFEENLCIKNEIHCRYLIGLGYLGLGNKEEAEASLLEAYTLNRYHIGVLTHLKLNEQLYEV
jgi:tetratricopeptide (TPR) repeat protein